jgi:Flp pilus assembly protein TadG
MFAMIFIELDISWGIFVKATLEQACRVGARYAITNHIPDPNRPELCGSSATLTSCIKQHVQWAAGGTPGTDPLNGGLLGGTAGAAYVQVTYYPAGSTAPASGPTLPTTANDGGNVVMVSVTGYPITTLFGPIIAAPSASVTTVSSADTLTSVPTGQQPLP